MKKSYIVYAVILLLIAGLFYWSYWNSKQPGKYDEFAKCLTEKGVKFYGAYWCPRCADQKKLFGNSMQYIDYIECAIPGGDKGVQTAICQKEKIESYPTWEINGQKTIGVLQLSYLASVTGCNIQ